MKSIGAILRGIFLSLIVGLLLAFGIMWPISEAFFSPEMIGRAGWMIVLLGFACAVAFYFGGMISSYHAPSRRQLHGVLVAPLTFLISPVINLATGKGAFPQVDEVPGAPLLVALFLLVAITAAYVGARRGKALHEHNSEYLRRRAATERARKARTQTNEE